MPDYVALRDEMVRQQLMQRGIRDARVLDAMRSIPREAFVPAELQPRAYNDSALPIAAGQTISQPYIVALMVEALRLGPTDRVLEVGTGSGYAAAVLSRLCARVYSIELHPELTEAAAVRLQRLGCDNVELRSGNGWLGWPEAAPFDAIAVPAGSSSVPPALLEQLGPHGRLVIPLGERPYEQQLWRFTRTNGELERDLLGAVSFVPLINAAGDEPGDSPALAGEG